MKTFTDIIVSVEIKHKNECLAKAKVRILIEPGQTIRVRDITDACQRSVAHCIDELNKDLDLST